MNMRNILYDKAPPISSTSLWNSVSHLCKKQNPTPNDTLSISDTQKLARTCTENSFFRFYVKKMHRSNKFAVPKN